MYLFVTVLRLAWLVVGVLVGVVVGQGHLAELVDGVLVRFVVRQGHLAELLLMGGELQGKHGLNCYRSQGEGILKGGKKRKDELVKYIYCGLFNVQNLNDGSHYKTGSSGQTQALGR